MCDQSFLIQYNDPKLLFTTYRIDNKQNNFVQLFK